MEERVWCSVLGTWVRVLERRELFGQSVATVWPEGAAQVHQVPQESLTEQRAFALQDGLSTVAGARIWHALGTDLFLAPLVSPVLPLPHQFRVLRRALSGYPIRMLLADEVGLGKTIEAGLILKELKLRGLAERVLVLAPKSLLLQWIAEMDLHFHESFKLVEPGSWGTGFSLNGANTWKDHPRVVVSYDSVKPRDSFKGWSVEKLNRYNMERFHDLIHAGWDLVIIDESHKVAGAGEDVARYELARTLAKAVPNVLLLSATPHSGKTDAFRRLLALLDPGSFLPGVTLSREMVAPYVVRTEKRRAVNNEGLPLFAPRSTRLVKVPFREQHALQSRLYEEVSEYVIGEYNRSRRTGNAGSRLLLILIQRLVSSSTRAVVQFLEKRLTALGGATAVADWSALEGSIESEEDADEYAQQVARVLPVSKREAEVVRNLLELATLVEHSGPDARAEALYDLMLNIIQQDSEPQKKFLIFTEFTATQSMLKEFLAQRGFGVELLNGSMDLEERKAAQQRFRDQAQVLVSTDAGGEGLNLQFANVVFNYDLPWNPMRLEQRIGRVDRIGQSRPVRAINLVLENSVEARVYEVLQEKLTTILQEFGIDKTGDVLDSQEASATFEELARTALFKPDVFETEFERVLVGIREAVREAQSTYGLYADDVELTASPSAHPLTAWVETMLGDSATPGTPTIEELSTVVMERIKDLRGVFAYGKPVPILTIEGLGFGVKGWFSVWRGGVAGGTWRQQNTLPLFVADGGELFTQTAQRVWDALALRDVKITPTGETDQYDFTVIEQHAKRQGAYLFERSVNETNELTRRRRIALDMSFQARLEATNRIGLSSVRSARLRELNQDRSQKLLELQRQGQVLPDLRCLFLAQVIIQ